MATITGIDIQDMVRHWLSTPEGAYLGSSYGSNIKELLQRPQADGMADAVIRKMKADIPILQSLPPGSINIYSVTTLPDRLDLMIEVAGQIIQVPERSIAGSLSAQEPMPAFEPVRLVISGGSAGVESGADALITFTFSKDIGNSFDLGDISVTGGTIGSLSGSGLARTAVFTAGPDVGPASISVATGSYTDNEFPIPNAGIGHSLTLEVLSKSYLYIPGQSGFLTTESSDDFYFPGDFSIEVSGYFPSEGFFCPSGSWSTTSNYAWFFEFSSLKPKFSTNSGSPFPVTGPNLPINEFIDLRISRTGGVIKILGNGFEYASIPYTLPIGNPLGFPIGIGHCFAVQSQKCGIDRIKITKDGNTVLLMNFGGEVDSSVFIDESPGAKDIFTTGWPAIKNLPFPYP